MSSYYNDNVCYPEVRLYQLRLNSIRLKTQYRNEWKELKPDGIFGPKTKAAVSKFQQLRGITPVSGELGPTTKKYIVEADQPVLLSSPANLKNKYDIAGTARDIGKGTYDIASNSIAGVYKVNGIVNPTEKGLARIFEEWGKILEHQHDGLIRRMAKFPAKKSMRLRNVARQMEHCTKFIEKAKKYGINTAVVELGSNLSKENALKYIKEMAEVINNSSLFKNITVVTQSFAKIKKIISPLINTLNKIPGLKYFSVIEKIVKATIKMFQCDFEGAFKLYLDGLRELGEQLFIDAAVITALAIGGWIALVIVIVVIIGLLIMDYFFFSDDPGDTVVDKIVGKKVTTNLVTEHAAPFIYNLINE